MELKLLNEYPQRPMPGDVGTAMLSLLMGCVNEEGVEHVLANEFIPQVMMKRLQLAGIGERFDIDKGVIVFIALQCTTPGIAVMYAHTLKELAIRKGAQYTIRDLAEDFPIGFPDNDSLREAWDAQKMAGAPGGNYLDTQEAWQ